MLPQRNTYAPGMQQVTILTFKLMSYEPKSKNHKIVTPYCGKITFPFKQHNNFDIETQKYFSRSLNIFSPNKIEIF